MMMMRWWQQPVPGARTAPATVTVSSTVFRQRHVSVTLSAKMAPAVTR